VRQAGQHCRRSDIESIFKDLDYDGSGQLSYSEVRTTMRPAVGSTANPLSPKKRATLMVQPSLPALPKGFESRGRQVLSLMHQFDEQEDANKSAAGRSTDRDSAAFERRQRAEAFDQVVRQFYQNEPKGLINQLLDWVRQVRQVRQKAKEARVREADSALIASLDVDGDGVINITEFEALSKTVSISKAQMRARFRQKDLGNSGVLQHSQMLEILRELREEMQQQQSGDEKSGGTRGNLPRADLSRWVAEASANPVCKAPLASSTVVTHGQEHLSASRMRQQSQQQRNSPTSGVSHACASKGSQDWLVTTHDARCVGE